MGLHSSFSQALDPSSPRLLPSPSHPAPSMSPSAPLPPQCRSWLLRAQAVPNRAPRSRASQPQPFIFDAMGLLHLRLKHRCEKPPARPATSTPPQRSSQAYKGLSVVWLCFPGSGLDTNGLLCSGAGCPGGPGAAGRERAWDSGLSPRYYIDR